MEGQNVGFLFIRYEGGKNRMQGSFFLYMRVEDTECRALSSWIVEWKGQNAGFLLLDRRVEGTEC